MTPLEIVLQNTSMLRRAPYEIGTCVDIDGYEFEYLGSGAERIVYRYGDRAYKLGYSADANKVEYELYESIIKDSPLEALFPTVYSYHPVENVLELEYCGRRMFTRIQEHVFRKYTEHDENSRIPGKRNEYVWTLIGRITDIKISLLNGMGIMLDDVHINNIAENGKIIDFAGSPRRRSCENFFT